MSEKFFTELDDNYIRTPYNCIINSVVQPINDKNRESGDYKKSGTFFNDGQGGAAYSAAEPDRLQP